MLRFTADVEDPTTGEITTIEAESEADLDRKVEQHLYQSFPDLEEG